MSLNTTLLLQCAAIAQQFNEIQDRDEVLVRVCQNVRILCQLLEDHSEAFLSRDAPAAFEAHLRLVVHELQGARSFCTEYSQKKSHSESAIQRFMLAWSHRDALTALLHKLRRLQHDTYEFFPVHLDASAALAGFKRGAVAALMDDAKGLAMRELHTLPAGQHQQAVQELLAGLESASREVLGRLKAIAQAPPFVPPTQSTPPRTPPHTPSAAATPIHAPLPRVQPKRPAQERPEAQPQDHPAKMVRVEVNSQQSRIPTSSPPPLQSQLQPHPPAPSLPQSLPVPVPALEDPPLVVQPPPLPVPKPMATPQQITQFFLAVQEGDLNQMRQLLGTVSIDVTVPLQDGVTGLHFAAYKGLVEVARLLLDHGAAVAAKDRNGSTPLHYASHLGHAGMVSLLLLGRGVKINAAIADGSTCLHLAARGGHAEVARLLLAHGAALDATNKMGDTTLLVAVLNGHESVARVLLNSGAYVNAANKDGSTCLHVAAQGGHVSVVSLLLERGADVHARDKAGRTSRDLALLVGNKVVAAQLGPAGRGCFWEFQ